jgi:two-component system response regulator MprA
MRVLVVEDEPRMAGLLKRGLEEEGYAVMLAPDGQEAVEMALSTELDAIILDVMLPKLSGFEVARRLRQTRSSVPILMLTARDATKDVVTGLDLGADDYLTKPFSFEILLARLRALTRRAQPARSARIQVADLVLDPSAHEVWRGSERVPLTRTEFNLLEFLMRRAGRVIPRQTLIDAVWGLESEIENNTLDAFIRLLRAKLEGRERRRLIHTVRGVGYCLRDEEAL